MVDKAILVAGLQHAHHHANHQGDAQGDQAEAHGHAGLVTNQLGHRLIGLNAAAGAQVKLGKQLLVEAHQLRKRGIKQTGALQAIQLLLVGELDVFFIGKIIVGGHQPQQKEHHRNHQQDGNGGLQHPLEDVSCHALSP